MAFREIQEQIPSWVEGAMNAAISHFQIVFCRTLGFHGLNSLRWILAWLLKKSLFTFVKSVIKITNLKSIPCPTTSLVLRIKKLQSKHF
jgi:hypothetical protein